MTRARDVANIDGLLTTTGDIYYASAASTPARLGIGSASQVLSVSSGIPAWTTPASGGKVLQVVMATTSTEVSNSTTTLQDSGVTATITPTLNTSKVLVLITMPVAKTAGNSGSHLIAALFRDATNVLQFDANHLYTGTALNGYGARAFNYLDSPATTSATTYKVKFSNVITAAAVKTQPDSASTSTIILLEIGA